MRLVSVVTSTRSPRLTRALHSPRRSSSCPAVGAHFQLRIHKARGPDDLLDHEPLRAVQFPGAGRGRDVHGLPDAIKKFLEIERPVVQGRGKAKAEIHQRGLARTVAVEHGSDLRHGDVRLVHEEHEIIGEIVDERGRGLPGPASVQMQRIVLDAVAIAQFLDLLQVETWSAAPAAGPPRAGCSRGTRSDAAAIRCGWLRVRAPGCPGPRHSASRDRSRSCASAP